MARRTKTSVLTFFVVLMAIVSACILPGCIGHSADSKLRQAESLIIEYPDSAVAMLAYMDTADMSERQRNRQELLFVYTQLVYGNRIPIDSAGIASGDKAFAGTFDKDEIKWLIVKSEEAHRTGNPVARIELLKDAEFLAIRENDTADLGIVYLFLAKVYEQGFNGTVSRFYADKALEIFRQLNWTAKVRDARMAIVGAYCAQRDFKSALDSLKAMETEVMSNAHDSYRAYFLDQLARSYDENGDTRKAIDIWNCISGGVEPSSNTLAHRARAYCHINELDSAYMLILIADSLPHGNSDEYLCRNVEYEILERMGRTQDLARVDSLREAAANSTMDDRQLENTSLALNIKYDSAARKAWIEAAEARSRTGIAISVAILAAVLSVGVYVFLRKRNQLLKLQHENDMLKIRTMQDNLFESDSRNMEMSDRIAGLFRSRFRLIDSLAATYFECRDTAQEQKRIYSEVKSSLSDFSGREATQELADIVNGYNDNLMDRFKADFPKLSDSQYRLALYLFCGFSLSSISVFTGTELRNIYVYKSRLKSVISKSDSPLKAKYLDFF